MPKKILVLGATGAMGQYLVPILAEKGYQITAVSLDEIKKTIPNVTHIKADAKEPDILRTLLSKHFDGLVDFMIYPTRDLSGYLPQLLGGTSHYIYFSSYRVYDNKEHPIRETSPRLIDTSEDTLLRNSDDYSIYKARGENIIRSFPAKNWTIVRPAITYSYMRYQLVTLEAPNNVGRAFAGKSVVLPEQARNIQATMSWAGDMAQMLAELLFNNRALGETFTISTAEHHTWGDVADYYKDICGLKPVWVDKEDYIRIINPDPHACGPRWQLEYDRLFDRIIDNSRILLATGMRQKDLMPLYEGLKREIDRCPRNADWTVNTRMDEYLRHIKQ